LLISSDINIEKTSSIFRTKSWPNRNFPDFLNLIILVNTNLSLIDLFKKIKSIEKSMGRTKKPKNYPRICDIDIIDFNNIFKKTTYLNNKIIVPHKNMHKRNFVLIPLFEINKNWIHPKFKKNIVNLISYLSINDLRSIKLT
jgi:2-amino-4-hydroxy-6-hydroxymethyldihydropteridine pyrophosphokinase